LFWIGVALGAVVEVLAVVLVLVLVAFALLLEAELAFEFDNVTCLPNARVPNN
jgi:hypothetical protein